MYFLGLDMSLSSTGACIIDKDYNIIKMATLSTSVRGAERLLHLRNKLEEFIEDYKGSISLTCIESYAYNKKDGKLFEIGEWGGVARLFLFENSLEFILAAPLQVKKAATGKGESSTTKSLIMLDIYKNYGVEIRQDDLADSYILARIAHDFKLKVEKGLTKPQQEVIKAINKSINDGTIGVYLR